MASRPAAGQGALFDDPGTAANKPGSTSRQPRSAGRDRPPIEWPGGIRPWDPIDAADTDLGWEYRFVSPRRAVEIRQEISRG